MTDKIPSLAECIESASETEYMVTREGALADVPALLEKYFPGAKPFIVADKNTMAAAGDAVLARLKAAGIPASGSFIYGTDQFLHGDYKHISGLAGQFADAAKTAGVIVPVSVGSGAINDLVKRAAFESKLKYLCVPTAASVDGYSSDGAALLHDGFKQTFPCDAPLVIAADSAVLAKAPAYLSSSGFGDLAGKIIAGTDWAIADIMAGLSGLPGTDKGAVPGSKKIDGKAWAMVQLPLKDNLAKSVNAARGDTAAVGALFDALAVTGFSMQYMRDSRPVSGSEHLFSHVWEMEDLCVNGVPVTHGHKVALGTLASAAFTECLFELAPSPPPSISRADRVASVIRAFTGLEKPGLAAVKTAGQKFYDEKTAALINGYIQDNWQTLKEKVGALLPPYGETRSLLEKAGCPVKPADINLSRAKVIATARQAQMIRVRYTVLDLAWDAGLFDQVIRRMEESQRYLA